MKILEEKKLRKLTREAHYTIFQSSKKKEQKKSVEYFEKCSITKELQILDLDTNTKAHHYEISGTQGPKRRSSMFPKKKGRSNTKEESE